jgi:hypothetical protein
LLMQQVNQVGPYMIQSPWLYSMLCNLPYGYPQKKTCRMVSVNNITKVCTLQWKGSFVSKKMSSVINWPMKFTTAMWDGKFSHLDRRTYIWLIFHKLCKDINIILNSPQT